MLVEVLVLIALAILFAHKIWKVGVESSVWQDEVFSLEVVQRSPQGVVEAMREDFHPPLYPLVLREWLAGLGALGVARTLTAARLLNVAAWVFLVLALAMTARRVLGRSVEAALLPVLVAGSAHLVQFTSDARSYGFAAGAVALVGLLLVQDLARAEKEPARSSRRWRRWVAIAALAAIAAWSHLLAIPLLLGLSGVWLAGSLRINGLITTRGRLAAPAVSAVVLLALLFPWLVTALKQVDSYRAAAPSWMTPATLARLVRVLWESIPLGRHGVGEGGLVGLFALAGWGQLVLLALLAGTTVRFPGQEVSTESRRVERIGGLGLLSVAWGLPILLWVLQRADLVRMFYAPRYPCLGAGLVGLAIALWLRAYRRGWRMVAAWATAALWLSLSVVGHATAASADRAGGLVPFIDLAVAEERSAQDAAKAAYPWSVAEALPEGRAARSLVPMEEVLCDLGAGKPAVALRLSPWRQLFSPHDLLLDEALRRGLLAREQKALGVGRSLDYEARLLLGSTELSERWCKGGIVATEWLDTRGGEWFDASMLRPEDGWSFLDYDQSLRPSRWSKATDARIEVSRSALGPNTRTLALVGFALGPGSRALIEAGGRKLAHLDREGPFALCLHLPEDMGPDSRLVVRSPLWRPDDLFHNGDRRWLGVQVRAFGLFGDEVACKEAIGVVP